MNCPSCEAPTRVVETRRAQEGAALRRRRACRRCGQRFTTFERYERPRLAVRKRSGRVEAFERAKVLHGLLRAAYKRPVDQRQVEALADRIEQAVERAGGELPAQRVGDMALAGLRELDRVAYLQFAAVYKGFNDPSEFSSELALLESGGRGRSVRAGSEDLRSPANVVDRRRIDG